MKPNISEFSYGFALIDELVNWHGTPLTAAPVFPSLYQEGQVGGGYDVKLQRLGIPLFLQFKLSHYMVRSSAQEVKTRIASPPFYRMHIRPSRHSDQHEMLLDLESAGNEVYYVVPAFHTAEELNEAYLLHHVCAHSLWIKPSLIGHLPDGGDHHLAFVPGRTLHFCSEPQKLESRGDFEEFERAVTNSFEERSTDALQRDALDQTARHLAEIAEKHRFISSESKRISREQLAERHPLYQIAFYSQVFLDSQFFIVTEQQTEEAEPE